MVICFDKEYAEEGKYAALGTEVVIEMCEIMRKYKNRVLTVFCFPNNCENLKDLLFGHLRFTTVVEIYEESVYSDKAHTYLHTLSEQHGTVPNRQLECQIVDGTEYYIKDLNLIFEKWYDEQMSFVRLLSLWLIKRN